MWRAFNDWLWGNPAPQHVQPDVHPERIEAPIAPAAQVQQHIDHIAAQRQLEIVQQQNEQHLRDFLWLRTQGKIIDENYVAFCSAVLNEYLDTANVRNPTHRRRLTEGVIKAHIYERLREQPIYIASVVDRVNQYNAELMGITEYRRWYWPFYPYAYTRIIPRTEVLNSQPPRPVTPYISLSNVTWIIIAGAAIGLTVRYGITRLWQSLTDTFTTHNPTKLDTLLSKIDTTLNYCQTTTHMALQTSTDISKSLCAIQDQLQQKSIVIQCLLLAKDCSTAVFSKICKMVEEYGRE